jgi:predicted metal-dependent phosphoesterase TrpH
VPELKRAGQELGFLVIGGVELSVEFSGITHVLGLDLAGSPETPLALAELQAFRLRRNKVMFERLLGLGLELSWERVQAISGGGQMGRPHLARALIEKGYCQSVQEAFNKYLGKGRPAYVPKKRLSPREAFDLLSQVGFAPVLAHPHSLGLSEGQWLEVLPEWQNQGLLGLEVYHPDHGQAERRLFFGLARRFDLVITAGSDFHGAVKRVPITWVKDHSPVGLEALGRLRSRLAK